MYRTVGILGYNLSECPQNVETAYKGLVTLVLEYASSVWYPHCSFFINDIGKNQNLSIHFVTCDYSYKPYAMTNILQDLRRKRSTYIIAVLRSKWQRKY